MDEDLISKKELLERYGISYGALYRWKRMGLIPESWFLRRSTPSGQETYFHTKQICLRVERILESKERVSLDALADMLGVSMLIHELAPDKIVCSPINVGSGTVKCAHGILPVPAPATELILRGVPVYGGSIRGELCTPTGAALLKHFSTGFGEIPLMSVSAAGYGTGTKNFDAANVVRAMIGESRSDAGEILELKCNLDDMTAEEVGYAQEMLFSAGALDVYTAPIGMKKNRPAVLLTCMCRREQRDEMLRCIFANTSTLGVREYVCSRYTLSRREESVETEYGAVHIKSASGWGVSRSKPEYEDVARIARETGRSFHEVASGIMSAQNNAPVSH
mgnify:CR=1 FL=1